MYSCAVLRQTAPSSMNCFSLFIWPLVTKTFQMGTGCRVLSSACLGLTWGELFRNGGVFTVSAVTWSISREILALAVVQHVTVLWTDRLLSLCCGAAERLTSVYIKFWNERQFPVLDRAAGRGKEHLCFSSELLSGVLALIKGRGYFCILTEYLAFKSI